MDEKTITISKTEYLRLQESQKNCFKLEDRVHKLDTELRSAFRDIVRMNADEKAAKKEVVVLRAELGRMAQTVTYIENKLQDYNSRRFFGFYPNRPMEWKWRYGTDNPTMIPVDQYQAFKDRQYFSALNDTNIDHSVNESNRYFNRAD